MGRFWGPESQIKFDSGNNKSVEYLTYSVSCGLSSIIKKPEITTGCRIKYYVAFSFTTIIPKGFLKQNK